MPDGAGGLVGAALVFKYKRKNLENKVLVTVTVLLTVPVTTLLSATQVGEARLVALSNTPFVTVAGQDRTI